MAKRKKAIKRSAPKKLSPNKFMFLSIVLLFIIFEALFIMKSQAPSPVQSNSLEQQVAGESTQR